MYGGRVVSFQNNFRTFCSEVGGLGSITKTKLLRRFELNALYYNHSGSFQDIDKEVKKAINILLSQITSVNSQISEIHYFNLIRLYLIKSHRGKSQALGQPSRGQRT